MPGATPEDVAEAISNNPALVQAQVDPNPDFEADPRDHATPLAMLQLLLAIDGGTAMSPESREFLLGVMSRTRSGPGRLKGLMPKGTLVAHKTGTAGGIANDVGYITLPDGRRFAIAVYTNSNETSVVGQGSGNCRDRPHDVRLLLPGSGGEPIDAQRLCCTNRVMAEVPLSPDGLIPQPP